MPLTTIRDVEEGGDGTVARLSFRPDKWDDLDPRRGGYVEHHDSIPSHLGILGKLQELFTGSAKTHRGPTGEVSLGVDVPDLAQAGEQVEVEVTAPPGADRLGVVVEVRGEDDRPLHRARAINLGGGRYRSVVAALPPGIHRVGTTAEGAARVTALLVVVTP